MSVAVVAIVRPSGLSASGGRPGAVVDLVRAESSVAVSSSAGILTDLVPAADRDTQFRR